MSELTRICETTGDRFRVSEAEQALLRRLGEHNSWIGGSAPLPRSKPCEVVRQIFSYGNLMYLFRRKSTVSQQPLISRFSERDISAVVSSEEFWSDRVDNAQFGRDYDFSKPFFEQFAALLRDVQYISLSRTNAENSEFVNGAQNVKNCYLCFSVVDSQDCLYCLSQYNGNDNVDCAGTYQSQFCYASHDLDNCYECQHSADCWSCRNCFGCNGCRSCGDCFGCFGLEQQSYCVFNEQYSKSAYEQFIGELKLSCSSGRSAAIERCRSFVRENGFQANRIINAEGCTGSYIFRSSNISESYHVIHSQDCGHMLLCNNSRDCWKGWASRGELCYASGVMDSQNAAYCYNVWGGEGLWYSYYLYNNCSHCFGSAMLKGKSYSILNKSYSKNEYFEMLPRIVRHMKETGEWGLFPLPKYSPNPYSESFATHYIEPLSEPALSSRGYRTERPQELLIDAKGISAEALPDDISAVDPAKYAGKIVECESTGKTFNLQRAELDFYLKFSIPLPRRHWRTRLEEQITARAMMPENLGT